MLISRAVLITLTLALGLPTAAVAQATASIAGLVLTTDCMIAQLPRREPARPQPEEM